MEGGWPFRATGASHPQQLRRGFTRGYRNLLGSEQNPSQPDLLCTRPTGVRPRALHEPVISKKGGLLWESHRKWLSLPCIARHRRGARHGAYRRGVCAARRPAPCGPAGRDLRHRRCDPLPRRGEPRDRRNPSRRWRPERRPLTPPGTRMERATLCTVSLVLFN